MANRTPFKCPACGATLAPTASLIAGVEDMIVREHQYEGECVVEDDEDED
jgi:hypothetical protein